MTTLSLNIDTVTRGMHSIDAALPGKTREVITALTFIMVERAMQAGLTEAEIHSQVDRALKSRSVAASS